MEKRDCAVRGDDASQYGVLVILNHREGKPTSVWPRTSNSDIFLFMVVFRCNGPIRCDGKNPLMAKNLFLEVVMT